VVDAAQKLPDVEFELIGYGLSDRSRARLGDFANIRFNGLVSQNDLHRYASKWWAGMIPFRPSAFCRGGSAEDLRVPPFRPAHSRDWSSGIAEYPLVRYATDRASFVSVLDKVQSRPDEQAVGDIRISENCEWEQRLTKLNMLIGQPQD